MNSLAETLPIDFPGSCTSFVKMQLAPSVHHLRVPITFVGVDTVGSRILHLFYVGVGT